MLHKDYLPTSGIHGQQAADEGQDLAGPGCDITTNVSSWYDSFSKHTFYLMLQAAN